MAKNSAHQPDENKREACCTHHEPARDRLFCGICLVSMHRSVAGSIPRFALLPVLHFNSKEELMGKFVLSNRFQLLCWALATWHISLALSGCLKMTPSNGLHLFFLWLWIFGGSFLWKQQPQHEPSSFAFHFFWTWFSQL